MQLSAAFVAIALAFAGAFMSLLLTWYLQGQRMSTMEGRLQKTEEAEADCIKREAELRARVVRLEVATESAPPPPPKPRRRKRRQKAA